MSATEAVPVLLITDIGRDTDDTIALLLLAHYQIEGKCNLVGVVATGGAEQERARVAKGWLEQLNSEKLDWKNIPVAAHDPLATKEQYCHKPHFTPSESETTLYAGNGADLILEMVEKYAGKLVIMAIAPLTSLQHALERDGGLDKVKKGLSKLYIQGQADIDPQTERLKPNFLAYNLRESEEASRAVFEKLQDHTPFTLLGKNAAYRVAVTRDDFVKWDQAGWPGKTEEVGREGSEKFHEGVMSGVAINGLRMLRRNNRPIFHRLFPIDNDPEDPMDETWQDKIPCFSHPYDPLLAMSFFDPELFDVRYVSRHGLIGNEKIDCDGVPDENLVHDKLVGFVTEVVSLIRENHQRGNS